LIEEDVIVKMYRFSLFALLFVLLLPAYGCAVGLKESAGITRAGFAIQVGAFKEVGNAERLTSRLQEKGVEAFYFRKENGVYAVRFGDYRSWDEAKRAAAKLQREKLIDAFFIASPDRTTITKPTEPSIIRKKPEPSPPPRRKSDAEMGSIAARTAERFVGIPYRWGGNTVVDGMDCSGFARAVYNLCGVNIPRTSGEQFRAGDGVTRDDLRDGDLVFFGESEGKIGHVGIYVGSGRFVHAPRRGDDIKISGLDEPYFVRKFIGARRYF
jgi:gamma-D-glutamyl-L-lysine dipeptidyl-peptidase